MKYIFVLLTILLVATYASAKTSVGEKEWQFRVLLDNKEIGYHNFRLIEQSGESRIESDAQFDVKVLFINAFRYRHNNTEYWRGNCLNRMDSETSQNSKQFVVSGQNKQGKFEVISNKSKQILDGCVRSFAYWDLDILSVSNLLNSQTGDYEPVTVKFAGEEFLAIHGLQLRTKRYELKTQTGVITLWYEWDSEHWLALEAPAKGNRTIRYEPRYVSSQLALFSSYKENH